MTDTPYGVLLDLDGTLVDSVYHHVLAWQEAFRAHGHDVALPAIHSAVGMGSDRLVPHLLGDHVPEAEALAAQHLRRFLELADRLRPTRGARALLADLEAREVDYVVATSAGGEESDALLQALGAQPPPIDSDAVRDSKPAGDLFLAACDELGVAPDAALVIGDSPWDAEAARRIGARPLAVRCGGFSDATLARRGAVDVVDDPRELIGQL